MQVIIPLAGKGTRLRPHTHTVPKPLIRVAGRPVMDWVMDRLRGLDVEELIFITGHLKEQVEAYARERYPIPSRFIEQQVQDGTAGAINLARPHVHGPVMIIFVDTVFDADLSIATTSRDDGIIWVKEVEDYQRFGVVVTDAYQWMIERGARIRTAEVAGWYDCGTVATTLETNRILLERHPEQRPPAPRLGEGGKVVEPCYIEAGVVVERSTVGPYASIQGGTVVRDSTVRNAIVGRGCRLEKVRLDGAILGDEVVLQGLAGAASLGAHAEVRAG